MRLSLVLPYPPSVNTYWRWTPRGVLVSERGREYRKEVTPIVIRTRIIQNLGKFAAADRLEVRVLLCPPDRRRRDIDNTQKALLDALRHAGAFADDEQVDALDVRRGPVGGGVVYIKISQIAGTLSLEAGLEWLGGDF